jgi:hypothetical protein
MWGAFSFIYRNASHPSEFSFLKIFNENRQKVPLLMKNKILKRLTENLPNDDSSVSIHVNRKKARDFFESGKVDEKGEYTIFG